MDGVLGFFAGALILGLLIALVSAIGRGSQLAIRMNRAEAELGYARQAYDALAARLWALERVVAELRRAGPAALPAAVPVAEVEAAGDKASPAEAGEAAAPEEPVESPPSAPEAPVERPPSAPEAPVARPPSAPEAPVERPPSARGAPVDSPPPVVQAPAPSTSPPLEQPMPPASGPTVEWERWIGVRGAAALGAAVLVVAALYFFKYSIEQGLISPGLRVATGVVVGLGCLVASDRTRRASHLVLANWLAGAGVAILYTAFWALRSVYQLVGTVPAFGLMIAVTAVCVTLAVRYESLAIAVLGLLGGFVTPFALSSGEDHPIGLFGYLLLLDVALVVIARLRRWPSLATLSLVGTALYQVVWIGGRMDPGRLWLGIAILVVFSLVFGAGLGLAGAARPSEDKPASGDAFAQVAGALLPFGFGLYFGMREDLGPHLYPIGILLCVLSAGASVVAYARRAGWIALAAAAASVAVLCVWLVRHDPFPVRVEVIGVALLLAAVFHVVLEVGERRERGFDSTAFAAVASLGAMFVILLAAGQESCVDPWPWLGAWAALGLLTLRHASFEGREPLHVGAAIALGVGLPVLHALHREQAGSPDSTVYLAVCASVPVVLLGLSFARRAEAGRRSAAHATALAALLLQIEAVASSRTTAPAASLGAVSLFGVLALVASARLGSGVWALVATFATGLFELMWVFLQEDSKIPRSVWPAALPLLGGTAAIFVGWPLLARRRYSAVPWAWRAAALAGPVWLVVLARAWQEALGDGALGAVPAGLGLMALGAALLTRRAEGLTDVTRPTAVASFGAASALLLVIAVPVQLDREWITIGWALEGLVLVALFRRLDHAGLKYAGLSLLGIVTLRLAFNPSVVDYHPHASLPVFNWLLYTYGVPALCLIGAWHLLRDIERERARTWESFLYQRALPLGAMACGLATILVLFAWLNVTILDAFSTGTQIDVMLAREPTRDLTLSIAWAVYAIGLLALGMSRKSAALRWASLVLVLVTVAKVFLYDLGNLKDLYRVASLVGLALSLILVSLAYQRFVFGKAPPKAP